jgi:pyruvate/2-oxoglutarate dehydrogenase complex dihydrolipoamide dehydrogenase (E3) component
MDAQRFDAVIIGAGQAGGPLAAAFARAGRRTALIERAHVGGTCINVGCTPTKTMVASARVAYLARRAPDYGVRAGTVAVDLAHVRLRKQQIVERFRAGSERRLEAAGVTLIRGEARFVGPRTLEVRGAAGEVGLMRGEIVCINTGARPARLHIPGLEDAPCLDSSSIMELDELPAHLLVLGGGYIGLEFGQMFRRFGSEVTIVQRAPRLLAREDADVADAVADILREDGIEVLLSTDAVAAGEAAGGGVQLRLQTPAGEVVRGGSHVLIAAGRVPDVDHLDLEAAGVETDAEGFVRANDRLETSVPGVYALGDVKGGPQFTHISYDDFRVLRTNLIDGGDASIDGRLVPYTVFIDPQLGRVGMTETEARASGRDVRVAKLPMTHVARAIETDETRGFIKAIVDARTDRILGCAVLGAEGGEIMSVVQVAMMGGLPFGVLRDGIFAHPTLSEALNNLFAEGALS